MTQEIDRTLYIISPMWPSPGSPNYGVFIKNMANRLLEEGFQVDSRAVIRGRSMSLYGKMLKHLVLFSHIAALLFRKKGIFYVHSPLWFSTMVLAIARVKKAPLVVHLHGNEVFPKTPMTQSVRPLVALMARSSDGVVVPSRYFGQVVHDEFRVSREKIFVSPSGGIDFNSFYPRRERSPLGEFRLRKGGKVIGYVGRLDEGKGWSTFLEVMRQLHEAGENVQGIVIGDGAEKSRFHADLRGKNLQDVICWSSFLKQEDLPPVYSSLDVFVFPTRLAETLGLCALEAMACGVPVVGSRIGALPEYIIDGETGYLCEPDDSADFTRKVLHILRMDRDGIENLRRNALAMARRYGAENVARELGRFLSEFS